MTNSDSGTGELLRLEDYCVITFDSTSQALRAEKLMKASRGLFLVVPTPREVSSSCGLSLKLRPEDAGVSYRFLAGSGVEMAGVFRIIKEKGTREVQSLDMGHF